MRISDWSSDVCSSDLGAQIVQVVHEWFSAGNHHGVGGMGCCLFHDLVGGCQGMKTGVPGLFDITPVTAYVTSSKSDKISSFSGIEAFSLDGVEGFHQWQKSAVFRNAGRGTADNTGALIFHFSVII